MRLFKKNKLKNIETESLWLKHDYIVKLSNKRNQSTKYAYRLIIAERKESGETLYFLTNNMDYEAVDVTNLYRKRWEIEVFFKCIKQYLGFNHLFSRSINGIQVEMYIALITAILLIVYKIENKLDGFKIPKLSFANELEGLIIKDIVALCGGDPDRVDSLFLSSS